MIAVVSLCASWLAGTHQGQLEAAVLRHRSWQDRGPAGLCPPPCSCQQPLHAGGRGHNMQCPWCNSCIIIIIIISSIIALRTMQPPNRSALQTCLSTTQAGCCASACWCSLCGRQQECIQVDFAEIRCSAVGTADSRTSSASVHAVYLYFY